MQMQQGRPKEVALAARRLMRGEISYQEFLNIVPEDPEDEATAELLDLIEHIPKRGGLFGASDTVYQAYMARLEQAILALE